MSDVMNDSFLDDMQQELVALWKSDEVLGQLPILYERTGDIENEVAKNLGLLTDVDGKLGACVIVQSPTCEDNMVAAPGGILDVDLTMLVLEEPTLNDGVNGFRIRALRIARRIVRVGKLYAAQGLCTSIVPKKPVIVRVVNPMASIAYEVRLRTTETSQGVMQKVAQPTIAPTSRAAPQTVTITCLTAGADIYYTLDGTAPWAGNGMRYEGPFDVPAAGTVRARAFKAGMVGSNAAGVDFTD